MKKILICLLIMLSVTVSAEPLSFTLSGGVFSANYSTTKDITAISYETQKYGVILSADSNKYFGLDLMLTDKGIAIDIKTSLDVSSFKLSAGIGVEKIKYSVTDNDDSWDKPVFTGVKDLNNRFIEVEHDSGVFLRYSIFNLRQNSSVEFLRTRVDLYGSGIDNRKEVLISAGFDSYMLGYKVAF